MNKGVATYITGDSSTAVSQNGVCKTQGMYVAAPLVKVFVLNQPYSFK
jgi:hypothetical protein